jgi:hypothetical protein
MDSKRETEKCRILVALNEMYVRGAASNDMAFTSHLIKNRHLVKKLMCNI